MKTLRLLSRWLLLVALPIVSTHQATPAGADDDSQARLELGETAWRSGDDSEAADQFLRILEDEPDSTSTAPARLGLARTLIASGDSVAAAQLLQRSVADSEDATIAVEAAHHLALLYRFAVLPAAGEARWRSCDPFAVLPEEIGKLVGITAQGDGEVVVMGRQGLLDYSGNRHRVIPLTPTTAGRPFHDPQANAFVVVGDGILPVSGGRKQSFRDPGSGRGEPLDRLKTGGRDAFGQWYLLDERSDRVLIFAPDGLYVGTLGKAGDVEAVDVAQDGRGRLYLLDRRQHRVLRMDPGSTRLTTVVESRWKRPDALAVDAHDHIYVLDRGQNQVLVYGPDGDLLTTVGPLLPDGCELRTPEDLAVDARGRIFVADSRAKGVFVLE